MREKLSSEIGLYDAQSVVSKSLSPTTRNMILCPLLTLTRSSAKEITRTPAPKGVKECICAQRGHVVLALFRSADILSVLGSKNEYPKAIIIKLEPGSGNGV